MARILPQVEHVVVVMFENRSFDMMLGWLHNDGSAPGHFLPASNTAPYDGLKHDLWNPKNADYFTGAPPDQQKIFDYATSTVDPDPDPQEDFDNVTEQLYGPPPPNASTQTPTENSPFANLGFVVNYKKSTGAANPVQIMEPYSPDQLPVMSALARNYAVCDRWFCSVPSETWPNRAFVHAGTSNGHVNNGNPPNPLQWKVKTIFEVLQDTGHSWRIYKDTNLPALTGLMFPGLWTHLDHFSGFDDFKKACAEGSLPEYSFLEPNFVDSPNDYHPPHDVVAGEQFLYAIWQAVSASPAWEKTLLIIMFDEHGGTYDHVMPPWGAACPDADSNPGEKDFRFDRFGVRIPLVVVSPWIEPGTVFRSDTSVPYDHGSIASTLRDWLEIPADKMLKSARVAAAPTLAQLLTRDTPRTELPQVPTPPAESASVSMFAEPNHLQQTMVAAAATKRQEDAAAKLTEVKTRQDAANYLGQV
jgi:phospholipase C